MDSIEMKILVFQINGELYATNIKEVERILSYEKPTEIPDSPYYIEGVINYEGSVLPIVNIAKKFNIDSSEFTEDTKIIVSKKEGKKFGFIVDLVCEVKDINNMIIEETPKIIDVSSNKYLKGFIKLKEKIIIYLDLHNILSEEEKLYF